MPTEKEPLRDRLEEALDERRPLADLMAEEEEPTLRERLSEASKMGQEPKDRIWGLIIAMGVLIFALGGLILESRFTLTEAQTQGYQRGAVDCLILIVDGDRDFELPRYCLGDDLVGYYPNSVCDLYFATYRRCGIKEASE